MEKWLHNNKVMGITAVLVAILLWVVIHLDEQGSLTTPVSNFHSRTINEVQITTIGLNEELFHVQSIDPAYVNIVLRGQETIVNHVRPNAGVDHNQIQLDLSKITEPGQHTLELTSVGFPENVEVMIYPSSVTVTIEEIQSKEVPVVIEVIGNPAEGYIADHPIVNPIRAIVNVPSSMVQQIVEVRAVIDITDAKEALEMTSKLVAIDQKGEEVEALITPAVADVIVPITSPFKSVPLQIKLLNQPADGYSVAAVKQSVSDVTIYGPESLLESIDIYEGPDINLAGLNASRKFTLELPLYDDMHQIKPEVLEVEIDIVRSSFKTLEGIPITISGANHNYVTRVLQPESLMVDVTIEGAQTILRQVDSDNVQAIVDVSNLPQGTHELTVKFNLPSYVKYGEAEEMTVVVQILPHDDVPADTDPDDAEDDDGTNNETDVKDDEGETIPDDIE